MLATSLAQIKYIDGGSSSFKPILNIGLLQIKIELNSSKVAWTNHCFAFLIFLARALIIGPSGTSNESLMLWAL